MSRAVVLIILDGWGLGPSGPENAISAVDTPEIDGLRARGSTATLSAAGEAVGLPDGQMGNSEVGHLNLGAGFRVLSDLPRISHAIRDGSFFTNVALLGAMQRARESGQWLHLIGLCSHGGVHSHVDHLEGLLELASREGLANVALHLILDGRDTPPCQAIQDIPELESSIRRHGLGRIATVSGRFYAMDRDQRWDRVARAWSTIVDGTGSRFADATSAVADAYARGLTDEFMEPVVVDNGTGPLPIMDGDEIIIYNFRADRARELTQAFVTPGFSKFDRRRLPGNLHVTTFGEYEAGLPVHAIAFPPTHVVAPLARVVSDAGLTQCHLAETEKYAHVTFFFNGGREEAFPGEDRILVPSPRVPTYDQQPEMSARAIADEAVARILRHDDAFVVMNFANPDMVGHTGDCAATQVAIATVDAVVGQVVRAALHRGRVVALTADHGNAELMVDPATGGPWTAHTTNPVPFIIAGLADGTSLHPHGELSNVAPTLLEIMGLPVPPTMTSTSLLAHASEP